MDGTRSGQQQGKLVPAHLHGLVTFDGEDGLVSGNGNRAGVLVSIVALGNGGVAHPGVIKFYQHYDDVVGPWGSKNGLNGASGETVADVHVSQST